MTREQIKAKAKTDISGQIFLLFVIILVSNLTGSISSVINFYSRITNGFVNYQGTSYAISIPILLIGILLIPMKLGVTKIFIKNSREKNDINASEMFVFYKNLNQSFQFILACIIRLVYIILGTICLIIPGIIMSLRYYLMDFVFAEDPTLTYKQTMEKTKEMMKNHLGDLFALCLSFIGWFILTAITLGLAYIYVLPYYKATLTNFYENIRIIEPVDDEPEKQENDTSFMPYKIDENQNNNNENKCNEKDLF